MQIVMTPNGEQITLFTTSAELRAIAGAMDASNDCYDVLADDPQLGEVVSILIRPPL